MTSLWQRITTFFKKADLYDHAIGLPDDDRPSVHYIMDNPVVNGSLLLGLSIDEVKKKFPGIVIRIVRENGKSKTVYSDCLLWRHNVETQNGKIVKVNNY